MIKAKAKTAEENKFKMKLTIRYPVYRGRNLLPFEPTLSIGMLNVTNLNRNNFVLNGHTHYIP